MKRACFLLITGLAACANDKPADPGPPPSPPLCSSEVSDGDDPCAYPEKPLLWVEGVSNTETEIIVADGTNAVPVMTICLHVCTSTGAAPALFGAYGFEFSVADPGQVVSLDAGLILEDGSPLFRHFLLRDDDGNVIGDRPAEFEPRFLSEASGGIWVGTATKSDAPAVTRESPLQTTLEVDIGSITAASINEVFIVEATHISMFDPLPDYEFQALAVVKKTKQPKPQRIRVQSE